MRKISLRTEETHVLLRKKALFSKKRGVKKKIAVENQTSKDHFKENPFPQSGDRPTSSPPRLFSARRKGRGGVSSDRRNSGTMQAERGIGILFGKNAEIEGINLRKTEIRLNLNENGAFQHESENSFHFCDRSPFVRIVRIRGGNPNLRLQKMRRESEAILPTERQLLPEGRKSRLAFPRLRRRLDLFLPEMPNEDECGGTPQRQLLPARRQSRLDPSRTKGKQKLFLPEMPFESPDAKPSERQLLSVRRKSRLGRLLKPPSPRRRRRGRFEAKRETFRGILWNAGPSSGSASPGSHARGSGATAASSDFGLPACAHRFDRIRGMRLA